MHIQYFTRLPVGVWALSLSAFLLSGCLRQTNPIRQPDGTAIIPLERAESGTTLACRVVTYDDAIDAVVQKENQSGVAVANRSIMLNKDRPTVNEDVIGGGGAENHYQAARKNMLSETAPDSWTSPVVRKQVFVGSSVVEPIKLKNSRYGDVYLVQVLELDSANKVVRNDVTVADNRPESLSVGTQVGVIFVPNLSAVLSVSQFSFFPFRNVAKDSYHSTSYAWLVDGISFDGGIAGGAIVGDAPARLGGKMAFTFGGGWTPVPDKNNFAIKAGFLAFRDADRNDNLSAVPYFGLTYDVLNGLVGATK